MEKTIETPDVQKPVEKTTPTKEWLVNYVGNIIKPAGDEVTVEMIIQVMAEEFPEFLLPVAEENFIRGYKQAFVDIGSSDAATTVAENKND
tara:strand:- start:166 stop:438 length:273 start_codon:yes stop_codon:yes gene_type:complete